jgi:hypothetical protein
MTDLDKQRGFLTFAAAYFASAEPKGSFFVALQNVIERRVKLLTERTRLISRTPSMELAAVGRKASAFCFAALALTITVVWIGAVIWAGLRLLAYVYYACF